MEKREEILFRTVAAFLPRDLSVCAWACPRKEFTSSRRGRNYVKWVEEKERKKGREGVFEDKLAGKLEVNLIVSIMNIGNIPQPRVIS